MIGINFYKAQPHWVEIVIGMVQKDFDNVKIKMLVIHFLGGRDKSQAGKMLR